MAATQSGLAGPDTAAAIAPLLQSLNDIFAQFAKGVTTPTIAFSDVSKLGSVPLDSWKGVIEQAVKAEVELRVSLETNAITVVPVGKLMSADAATVQEPVAPDNQLLGDEEGTTPASEKSTTSAGSAKKTGKKARAKKNKAPRPKNAFIIYRKEWHPKIVANFPDLHNNDISVLIGRQWKGEPKEVQEKYQSMAAEEKRQHLIDNPGYQYQPRKPSEKKKRMTKNKLAKLRSQSVDASHDPMQEIDGLLAAAAADNQFTVDAFQAPYRQGFPMIGENPDQGFIANGEHDDMLYNQLTAWNAGHAASQTVPRATAFGLPCVDGQLLQNTKRYDVPVTFSPQEIFTAARRVPNPGPATATGHFNGAANNAEVDRHQTLFDDAMMNDLFDLDAFDVEIN